MLCVSIVFACQTIKNVKKENGKTMEKLNPEIFIPPQTNNTRMRRASVFLAICQTDDFWQSATKIDKYVRCSRGEGTLFLLHELICPPTTHSIFFHLFLLSCLRKQLSCSGKLVIIQKS